MFNNVLVNGTSESSIESSCQDLIDSQTNIDRKDKLTGQDRRNTYMSNGAIYEVPVMSRNSWGSDGISRLSRFVCPKCGLLLDDKGEIVAAQGKAETEGERMEKEKADELKGKRKWMRPNGTKSRRTSHCGAQELKQFEERIARLEHFRIRQVQQNGKDKTKGFPSGSNVRRRIHALESIYPAQIGKVCVYVILGNPSVMF